MYTATIQITITQFNPIGGPNIVASLAAPINTSARGSGGSNVFSTVAVPGKGPGQSIVVTTPNGYTGSVQLTFQLPNPDYVLLGIAVNPSPASGGGTTFGRQQLRTVTINRDTTGSQMTVTDACLPEFNQVEIDYDIIVQSLVGPTSGQAQIGIIDPDEENSTGD